MKVLIWVLVGLMGCFSAVATAQEPKPAKAAGAVELKDAAGDMTPIRTNKGQEPPLDVVLLAIKSDGKRITFDATLNDPPGGFAIVPVTVFIDADNSPATGVVIREDEPGGFEYQLELDMCIKFSDGGESCVGGSEGKVVERYGAVNLDRFKEQDKNGDTEELLDAMDFPAPKGSVQTPVTGKVVEGSIKYEDIKVKPGQTIRLLAQETGGNPKEGKGYFPIVLLTLK